MRPARIYPWRRMRRFRAPSSGLDKFFAAQFSAGYITNMSGFDLRQALHTAVAFTPDTLLWRSWLSNHFAEADRSAGLLKTLRQPSLRLARCLRMQAVIRCTFGISDAQSRKTSPVQSCR